LANCGIFDSTPSARNREIADAIGCGHRRSNSGRALSAPNPGISDKKSLHGSEAIYRHRGFIFARFLKCRIGDRLTRQITAMLSPSTSLPFSCKSPANHNSHRIAFRLHGALSKFFESSGVHQSWEIALRVQTGGPRRQSHAVISWPITAPIGA